MVRYPILALFLFTSLGCTAPGDVALKGAAVKGKVPPAPRGLKATATGGKVQLTWQPAETATSYKVFRSDRSGVAYAELGSVVPAAFTDATVKAFHSYYYVVQSFNGAGGSPNSAEEKVAITSLLPEKPPPVPIAPTDIVATAYDGYIELSWAAQPKALSYNLYWSNSTDVSKATGKKVSTTSTLNKHGGLVNGQTYFYVVTAVYSYGESVASGQVSATPVNGVAAADPLYALQWHLDNTGQLGADSSSAKVDEDVNVLPAWEACGVGNTCRGEGVRIAVVDDGLELGHEDLAPNIAFGASYDYVDRDADPTNAPDDDESGHGTAVAGIIAARDQNGVGVRGVAPRANLVGYNFLLASSNSNTADAMMRRAAEVDVSNNSWGAGTPAGNLAPAGQLWRDAIDYGLANGRGGRGTIYVFSAGNSHGGEEGCGDCTDNTNYSEYSNYHGILTVGAFNAQGEKSSYSERGATVLVSAPGGEFCDTHTITTTDRTGSVGFNIDESAGIDDFANLNYTRCMNGTSSAAPNASGVVALVLQANPALGWRDVRAILAESARQIDPLDIEWDVNDAGYPFNPKYGFGAVDASAAVTLAKAWGSNVGTEVVYRSGLATPNAAIPDENSIGVSNSIAVSGSGISAVEFVEVSFTAANHTYAGDLEIGLVSPGGTVSWLAESHACVDNACSEYDGWVFGSANFLGEAAEGTWTLVVKDLNEGDTGTFESWRLTLYGN